MGGEPFLNPTLPEWIQGINELFGIDVQVLTNGTRFKHAGRVYDALAATTPKNQIKNHVGVSMHNPDQWESLKQDILDFLAPGVEIRPKGKNIWNSDWNFIDRNGIQVNVYTSNQFMPSALIPLPPAAGQQRPRFTLHNSDPQQAHDNCAFARWKSYHFIRGRLYKCGPVALLPEFHAQYPLEISQSDVELLHAYQPLTVDNFDNYASDFFAKLDDPIDQCRFCSTYPTPHLINPVQKKTLRAV